MYTLFLSNVYAYTHKILCVCIYLLEREQVYTYIHTYTNTFVLLKVHLNVDFQIHITIVIRKIKVILKRLLDIADRITEHSLLISITVSGAKQMLN